jgi:hypothetical protein
MQSQVDLLAAVERLLLGSFEDLVDGLRLPTLLGHRLQNLA